MMLNICTLFHKNVLNNFKVIEQTQFPCLLLQRGITMYNVCGAAISFSANRLMVLYMCTKFCENIFKSYGSDTTAILIITKGHNSLKMS